ncbi:MAG: bifunctional 23S rRNA (guanine(2069)-N(7))-methyltransferase RlmK/23S rRNA (guanine(2445)-N(2))-methyltransferase RlmL, partial [Gammaproteobacteria bacterium]|nr:bifunctional 23S rRNA (guanine(2069)-N(7))-methyltransferase RlmK/23S rRNA (guanine(2445)-N(2))-methyltransferase RlmL [Gammaproteobacteria bacterium]
MSSDKTFSLFASVPKGLEPLLARELRELGGLKVSAVQAGASFRGTLETAYRVCLWSRTANRVLLSQKRFRAASPEELYTGIQTIRWSDHLAPEGTLAVSFYTSNSAITHSQYGAQRVKDAIVDQFREEFGIRPSVDLARPHLRINVYLMKNEARVSLDLSGESLHRRGYRREGGKAPLKENLAAAILILGGWPELSSSGRPLLDLMCGSGTLPIEAALMAGDIAPGLSRGYFGFLNWKWHDSSVWERLLNEARERRRRGLERLPSIVGYDLDDGMVRVARDNIQSAGLSEYIQIENRDLGEAGTESGAPGLVVVNPPYGERLGEEQRLVRLYTRLGKVLRDRFAGWRAAVFTGNPELGRRMTLGSGPATILYNGALECRLFNFQIPAKQSPESPNHGIRSVPEPGEQPLSDGSSMLINRLRKNLKHTGRWARRNGISCYRLYDSDLPEYPMAVDVYSGTKTWVHVQEYAAPRSVDESRVEQRS